MRGFVLGVFTTLLILAAGAYLFVRGGAMATTGPLLPLEERAAGMVLRASIGNAATQKDPLPFDDSNTLAAVNLYKEHCAGMPRRSATATHCNIERNVPPAPQLFTPAGMVTDDPEGVTYWKVTHGIRLSGMPGFAETLSDAQRWQVTMLVAHADKLPREVQTAFGH